MLSLDREALDTVHGKGELLLLLLLLLLLRLPYPALLSSAHAAEPQKTNLMKIKRS